MFKFDEELERERRTSETVPVYHVGRGGAGNLVNEMGVGRRDSDASWRSSASRDEGRESWDLRRDEKALGFYRSVSTALDHGWLTLINAWVGKVNVHHMSALHYRGEYRHGVSLAGFVQHRLRYPTGGKV